MLYFTYVLYSPSSDRIYIGMTNNPTRRISEHNSGHNKSTKAYLPWEKIYSEEYPTRVEARAREKYLKSYRGRVWIRKTLLNDSSTG